MSQKQKRGWRDSRHNVNKDNGSEEEDAEENSSEGDDEEVSDKSSSARQSADFSVPSRVEEKPAALTKAFSIEAAPQLPATFTNSPADALSMPEEVAADDLDVNKGSISEDPRPVRRTRSKQVSLFLLFFF